MKNLEKQRILSAINDVPVRDLLGFINTGELSLNEMMDAGLEKSKIDSIQDDFRNKEDSVLKDGIMVELCSRIERGDLSVQTIQEKLFEGSLTAEALQKHTSLSSDLIAKIINYQKRPTDFKSWHDLPPLEANRTDLYFFGQPGSGKSCILASLFYYLRRKGMIISNTLNNQGNIYRNQLTDELENGILPDSTARDGVNYIPIELRNQNNKNMRHPLNFIEMSGELFEDAYNEGISERNLAAQKYLDNNNRKLIYFVLDYDMHGKGINLGGVSQASKMEHILVLLDKFGILQKTEGIFIVLSKADLFPSGAQRSSFAKEFVNSRYKNFIENCKDLVEKYRHRNAFELKLYPYSIGTVRFQNLLTQFDEMSPQEMIDDIMNYTFISKKSFWGKLF